MKLKIVNITLIVLIAITIGFRLFMSLGIINFAKDIDRIVQIVWIVVLLVLFTIYWALQFGTIKLVNKHKNKSIEQNKKHK